MAAAFSPYDDMADAEAALTTADRDDRKATERLVRLCRLLADGETHRSGSRTDLLADIGAARREHEAARARLHHALCALLTDDVPPIADATAAHVEAAMTARLRHSLSVLAVEMRVDARSVPVMAITAPPPGPTARLPQTTSPAAA